MASVTFILPTFNVVNKLDRCIQSLLAQTYTDWTVVACDDASTDGTWELLQQWAQRDSRFTVIRNDKNLRAAATRNRCLELATSEYVALQDADDYSSPDRLQLQIDFLQSHPEYDFVGGVMESFDENGAWQRIVNKPTPSRWAFLWRLPFNHAAVTFRKSAMDAVNGYRVAAETVRGQDLDLFMRMYAKGIKGYNLPQTIYYWEEDRDNFRRRKYRYRINEASIRFKGYCAMGIMPVGIIGVLKPLLVGLVPAQAMKWLKHLLSGAKKSVRGKN